jgi:hypothetical protein
LKSYAISAPASLSPQVDTFYSDTLVRAWNAHLCCLKEYDMDSCNRAIPSLSDESLYYLNQETLSRVLLALTLERRIELSPLCKRRPAAKTKTPKLPKKGDCPLGK